MPEPRRIPLAPGLPDRLAGAASVHLWRKYVLEAGLPLALDEEFAPDPWLDGWAALLERVETWRLVEAERDALDVRSSLVAGVVPSGVWFAMGAVWLVCAAVAGLLWGTVATFVAFGAVSAGGLAVYAWNERVRRRRLGAARRAHAARRQEVDLLVRELFAGAIDVTVGHVRYVKEAGPSRSPAPPAPGARC